MGCVCCSLSSFVSIVLQALERITLCTVCAMLVCCLTFTILSVLVMGIGIGFHYCTVTHAVEAMEQAAKASSMRRSDGGLADQSPVMRSVGKAVKRGFAHRLGKRELVDLMPSNNNTINDLLLAHNFTQLKQLLGVPADINITMYNNDDVIFFNNTMKTNPFNNIVSYNSSALDDVIDVNVSDSTNATLLQRARSLRDNYSMLTLLNRYF